MIKLVRISTRLDQDLAVLQARALHSSVQSSPAKFASAVGVGTLGEQCSDHL